MKKKDGIKKVKKICHNKDNNKIQEDIINKDGTRNYAYVTYIYNNIYIAGAIVLSETLRKLGSMSDLVILITKNVSDEGKEILKGFYDYILIVEEIKINNIDEKELKEYIILHSLNLIQYKKILLVNPNTIILKYPDNIFTLKTPACIYIENKNLTIKDSEWLNKYCEKYEFGKTISKTITDKTEEKLIKNENSENGIYGEFILLEPNEKEYNLIIKEIEKEKYIKYIEKSKMRVEQFLEMRYSGLWVNIDPKFIGFFGFLHWSKSYGIQFEKEYPYKIESKYTIEERVNNEEYQLWYKFYRDIINKYPEYLELKELNEANEISKYFIAPLCRKTLELKKKLTLGLEKGIDKIFNMKITSNYYYYHINISKEYDSERINYSYENDFIQNIIYTLIKRNKSKYWIEILEKIKKNNNILNEHEMDNNISNKLNNKTLSQLNKEDKENIISYYTKINTNVCIIMIITNLENETNFWLDNKLISNILYEKEIEITGSTLKNILFNIIQIYSYHERDKKLNSEYSNTENYKIKLLFYKTLYDSKLKGNNKDIYVFSDTNNKIRVLSILLNSNTLNKFINKEIIFVPEKKNNLYSTLTENAIFLKNMLIYQSLKKWIYNNYDGDEIENIIIYDDFELSDKKEIKKFVIVDTNIYTDITRQTKLETKKIVFINIIFTSTMTKMTNEYKTLLDNINDPRYYYQLDGIKIMLK
jgi:hypothetical protein